MESIQIKPASNLSVSSTDKSVDIVGLREAKFRLDILSTKLGLGI